MAGEEDSTSSSGQEKQTGGESETSTTGIPQAIFVDNVDEFMLKDENKSAEIVLQRLDEQHTKYKFMESQLVTKKTRLKYQIPDITTSLDIVKYMQSNKDSTDSMQTTFQMCDTLYVKATVPPSKTVNLWLGANVMLEYSLDDAVALLNKNKEAAFKSLSQVEEDLGFLRDQTTTVEVNMARVYNWDVKRRQSEQKTPGSTAALSTA
jgi:prefoldin subunit 5